LVSLPLGVFQAQERDESVPFQCIPQAAVTEEADLGVPPLCEYLVDVLNGLRRQEQGGRMLIER
jgi:hypothetical protein